MVTFPFRVNEAPDIDRDSVPEKIASGLKEKMVVEYVDWKIVDLEVHRNSSLGKERERLGSWLAGMKNKYNNEGGDFYHLGDQKEAGNMLKVTLGRECNCTVHVL